MLDQLKHPYRLAYAHALERHPVLNNVVVDHKTPEEAILLNYVPAYMKNPTQSLSPAKPEITINADNTYYSNMFVSRYWTLKSDSALLGITTGEFRTHLDLLKVHIFLHELGHAFDYLVNYVGETEKENSDSAMAFDLQHKSELATLPYPGLNIGTLGYMHQTGRLIQKFEKYRGYFKRKGIFSVNDLLKEQELAYKKTPFEQNGNNFSLSILINTWQSFGFPEITGRKSLI